MADITRIGLMVPTDFSYSRNVLRGIRRYALRARSWVFRSGGPTLEILSAMEGWRADGLIMYIARPDWVEPVRRLNTPVINVSMILPKTPFARVGVDGRAIGQTVAADLLQRGFRHFGYAGINEAACSHERYMGFSACIKAAGFACPTFTEPGLTPPAMPVDTWREVQQDLLKWIVSLPKPVAIMGCNDRRAWAVLEVCREAGLRVPEDVAVVGVDNDELVCELARPALSSVAMPAERVGYEAAGLLERMIGGEVAPAQDILLPPAGVITRHSSDILAIGDPEVAAAVRYIRDNVDKPINVEDVLSAVPSARRSLERKFRQALGRSPLQEIRRVRLDRAKELLAHTDMPMPDVAQRCGFTNARWLATVFHSEAGMSPSDFRRWFRLHDTSDATEAPATAG